ncbi:hypothetical protein HDU83_001212 [Entophlyctis luteolus]|nr:hypothetical protein HDU83_001212 [Entophlyctis luteolus]
MDTRFVLGTFRVTDAASLRPVVAEALRIGVRAFDSAQVYNNELELAAALAASA